MNTELIQIRNDRRRAFLIVAALAGLALVYLFQESLVITLFTNSSVNREVAFVFKKLLRVILNDSLMLLLIHAWFYNPKVSRLAFGLQLVDTLILLPIYLFLKLSMEGDSEISSPLLSQLHRLIVNPTLMILLIPALYFQRMK
jgi:exosortase F-associated protein